MLHERPLHLLVTEDEETEIEVFRLVFQRCQTLSSYHIARTGEEAILYLAGEPPFNDRLKYPFPSLLLLDLKMPGVTGFDVLRWLQAHPEFGVTPTVVFSASQVQEEIQEAYRLGANAYFVKPSDLDGSVRMLKAIHTFWTLSEWPQPPAGAARQRVQGP